MTDDELRRLVRDAVARHLGRPAPAAAAAPVSVVPSLPSAPAGTLVHPSHLQYVSLVNTTTACVIEPAATCDHCGYCKSHGH